MSRIGVKPIKIEKDVKVELSDHSVTVTGPLGSVTKKLPSTLSVKIEGENVIVATLNNSKQARSDHGTIRSIIQNMVTGVVKGYKEELELVGVGYRANLEGNTLAMSLGWTVPAKITLPDELKVEVKDNVFVTISGVDKEIVGLWTAKIRKIKKPEPYKGKGIKYVDEVVRRKTSKSVKEESAK